MLTAALYCPAWCDATRTPQLLSLRGMWYEPARIMTYRTTRSAFFKLSSAPEDTRLQEKWILSVMCEDKRLQKLFQALWKEIESGAQLLPERTHRVLILLAEIPSLVASGEKVRALANEFTMPNTEYWNAMQLVENKKVLFVQKVTSLLQQRVELGKIEVLMGNEVVLQVCGNKAGNGAVISLLLTILSTHGAWQASAGALPAVTFLSVLKHAFPVCSGEEAGAISERFYLIMGELLEAAWGVCNATVIPWQQVYAASRGVVMQQVWHCSQHVAAEFRVVLREDTSRELVARLRQVNGVLDAYEYDPGQSMRQTVAVRAARESGGSKKQKRKHVSKPKRQESEDFCAFTTEDLPDFVD
tara:strand:- start:402 stop:1475 length:1074 start_codon:yes stop_codon:yes gene_type:complete